VDYFQSYIHRQRLKVKVIISIDMFLIESCCCCFLFVCWSFGSF